MKKKVKIILIAIVVILSVIFAIYSYLKPLKIETKTLTLSHSEVSFVEAGVVKNNRIQNIYPLVGGEVLSINVEESDSVKSGDVLATLDSSALDFEIMKLENQIKGYEAQLANVKVENQANVDTLTANKNNLLSQLEALKAQTDVKGQLELQEMIVKQSKEILDRGLEDVEKYKILLDNGIISQSEFKDFKQVVSGYEVSYNENLVQLESLKNNSSNGDYYEAMKKSINAQISGINTNLSRNRTYANIDYYKALIEGTKVSIESLKSKKDKFNIITTIDGVVDEVKIDQVNSISGIEPAFVIQGNGNKEIEVMVNTRDIEEVKLNDKVVLVLDRRSGDIELEGEIIKIDDKATVEISPLGVEERKVLVTIEPENIYLNTGYDVDVKFIVYAATDKLVVPNSALYKKDEKDMVMIIRKGKTEEVEVVLGYELTGETIIEEGLVEGDKIITDLDAKGLSSGIKAITSNE